jgi:hypothetical protein
MDSKNYACGDPQVTRRTAEKFGCYPRVAIRGEHRTQGSLSIAACAVNRDPANLKQVNYVRFLHFLLQGVSANAVEGMAMKFDSFALKWSA